jgi:hypothetical protein
METPISVIENHSAINATRGRRGERRGEERRGGRGVIKAMHMHGTG